MSASLKSLVGKVAVVTGSTSGIGLATARRMAAAGADVVLNGFGEAAAIEATRTGIESEFGVKAAFSDANLMDPKACADLIELSHSELGSCDIVVNNAGIQHVCPVHSFPVDQWDAIMSLNLSAVFHTTRAALPKMYENGFGRIINIASVHGLVGSVDKGAYVAAKHGVVGLTKVTALEAAGTGVTCNAICPGWVLTPLVQKQVDARAAAEGLSNEAAGESLLEEKQPTKEFVDPDHLADLAVFLASDSGSSMTGVSLPMDGGWTAR